MTAITCTEALSVSRETRTRLQAYLDLLTKWQARINLVGPSTLADPWRRHVLDSGQLMPLVPEGTRTIVDLGSGAGFPGLVLAILTEPHSGVVTHLIESDTRKAAFLREAIRVTKAPAVVHAHRAERITGLTADVITARACAPLPKLLEMADVFVGPHTLGLFLKGQSVDDELTDAHKMWKMRVDRFPSRTCPHGQVLRIGEISRV